MKTMITIRIVGDSESQDIGDLWAIGPENVESHIREALYLKDAEVTDVVFRKAEDWCDMIFKPVYVHPENFATGMEKLQKGCYNDDRED